MRPLPKIPYGTIAALLAVAIVLFLAVLGTDGNGGEWSSLAVAITVVLLNMGLCAAFWFDYWKPLVKRLNAQKRGLERLEEGFRNLSDSVAGYLAVIERMQISLAKLPEHERKIDDLTAELDRRFSLPPKPSPRLPAEPLFSALPAQAPSKPEPSLPAMPATAEPAIPADRLFDQPAQNLADVARERLGALFVQEIKTASGADAATVWDRYMARLPASFQNLAQRQVHWDRDGLSLCFHTQSSGAYKDTGKCWLVQVGEQSLLFFPALAAATARKDDLPGCQIKSNDIVLYAAKLDRFIPPLVAQTHDGWAVHSDGTVEYR